MFFVAKPRIQPVQIYCRWIPGFSLDGNLLRDNFAQPAAIKNPSDVLLWLAGAVAEFKNWQFIQELFIHSFRPVNVQQIPTGHEELRIELEHSIAVLKRLIVLVRQIMKLSHISHDV